MMSFVNFVLLTEIALNAKMDIIIIISLKNVFVALLEIAQFAIIKLFAIYV
jgi:hypothetical protein